MNSSNSNVNKRLATCSTFSHSTNSNVYPPNHNPFAPNNHTNTQDASINWIDGPVSHSLNNFNDSTNPAIDKMMRLLVNLDRKQSGAIGSTEIQSMIGDIRSKVVNLSGKLDQQNQKTKFRNQLNEFLQLPNILQGGLLNIQMVYSSIQKTKAFKDLLDRTVDSERNDVFLKNVQANANQLIVKLTSQLVCIGKLEYNLINVHNDTMKAYIDIIHNTIAKVLSYLQHPSVLTLTDQVLSQLIEAQLPFKMIHDQSDLPKQPFWTEPSQWFLNPSLILLQYLKIASELIANVQNSITRPYLLSVLHIYSSQARESRLVSTAEYTIAQTLALETLFYDFNLVLQQIRNTDTDLDAELLNALLLELYRLCVHLKFSKLSDEMVHSITDLIDIMLSQFGAIQIRNNIGLVEGEIERNRDPSRLNWFLSYLDTGKLPPNDFGREVVTETPDRMESESIPMSTEPVASTSAETQSSFVPRSEPVSEEATLPQSQNNESPQSSQQSISPSPSLNDELVRQIQTLQSELNASKSAIDQLTKLISGPNGPN